MFSRKNIIAVFVLIVFVVSSCFIGGCSVGLYGGIDGDLYYSDNNAITGKKLGDSWKSRGSGANRSTSTKHSSGFEVFEPESSENK